MEYCHACAAYFFGFSKTRQLTAWANTILHLLLLKNSILYRIDDWCLTSKQQRNNLALHSCLTKLILVRSRSKPNNFYVSFQIWLKAMLIGNKCRWQQILCKFTFFVKHSFAKVSLTTFAFGPRLLGRKGVDGCWKNYWCSNIFVSIFVSFKMAIRDYKKSTMEKENRSWVIS